MRKLLYSLCFVGLAGSAQAKIEMNTMPTDSLFGLEAFANDVLYYLPNSFTPDGDEFNQTFQPIFSQGFDPFDFNLWVFDRWGTVVWESHDAEIGWDGTINGLPAESGTYIWKIEFKTIKSDERIMDIGHVNVLR